MSQDIWAGQFGPQWDALEQSFEENVQILGKPMAAAVETLKRMPKRPGTIAAVTHVDTVNKTITISTIKEITQ